VGVIPEDWEVKLLPDVLHFISGKAHEQHITLHGQYIAVNSKFISSDGVVAKFSDRNFCPAKLGDILTVMSDLPNGRALAKCFLVPEDDRYTVNQRVCILRSKGGNSGYFKYILNRNPYFMAFDDGVQQTHLLNGMFAACPLPVPPTVAEQSAIAEALSDVDRGIAAVEAVIAKKRALKTATMQALLSGTRRLPGFSGEWGATTLKQICDFITKGATPTTYGFTWQSSGVLFLRSECVSETGLDLTQSMFICDDAHRMMQRSAVANGDILVTITGNVGRVVRYVGSKTANLNQHIARIRISSSDVSPDYIYHCLNQPEVRRMYNQITTGQAYPQLSLVQVRNTTIPLPTYDEQCEIAAYLSDMDCEIIEQESILTKLRHLKTGMMQQLLTGKIRLI
jgi:type I restriction enzyme, S subunit